MSAASERRMISMLERVGLDPAIAAGHESDTVIDFAVDVVMKAMRERCQACTAVDTCEQWLVDKEACDNAFCPNAAVFDELKEICGNSAGRD